MGLDIYVKDVRRDELEYISDDAEDSFGVMCRQAPETSLRRGVMQHGQTMFNSYQLYRFVEELEALPSSEVTPKIQQVLDGARRAIRKSGYLYFVGD
ncbi:hypothetical protein [Streptomyces acidiscabies]|uniref:Uncharacterized protein n=1 Tax=Streptomyces acidiscabies TaxID=42234 RepID=A0A0L0KA48_9ACTN|nr:hypothetical protein [Streptomyces acidiscabies]KND34731.1 hypothetical protein IQ63_15580 [Streptomyces acidiscabies]